MCHFLLVSLFWWEEYSLSNYFSPTGIIHLSLVAFKIFFLSLFLRSSTVILCRFLWVYSVCSAFWIVCLGFWQEFLTTGSYFNHFFEQLFSSVLFLFWEFRAWMLNFLLSFHLFLRLCSLLLQSAFSLLFRLSSFYYYFFKFTDNFFFPLHSAIEPSTEVFLFQILYFLVLRFPFCSLYLV